eukprot:jgi/Ulvmu1/2648/UM014_0100.1
MAPEPSYCWAQSQVKCLARPSTCAADYANCAMIPHIVEEIEHVYETAEAYKDCAGDLRDAYVCLKRNMVGHRGPDPSCDQHAVEDAAAEAQEDQQIAEIEEKLGDDFLDELQKSVSKHDFADKIQKARECPHHSGGTDELDAVMGPLGSWTVVDKTDAVDAMASYLAAWLSQTPEAQNLEPKQLQAALLSSLKEMKKSRFRQLLVWGKYIYRGAAFAYSALMVYENPWLVRAVMTAMWSATAVVMQML